MTIYMPHRDHKHHEDQVRYTTAAVAAFLPAIWDDEYVLSSRPPRAASDGMPRPKSDPMNIPDWLLSAADVQVAFSRARLSPAEKSCLKHVVHLGYSANEIAAVWGEPPERIHTTCRHAIERLTGYLNGETPA